MLAAENPRREFWQRESALEAVPTRERGHRDVRAHEASGAR
jgi:hypothetical protein